MIIGSLDRLTNYFREFHRVKLMLTKMANKQEYIEPKIFLKRKI